MTGPLGDAVGIGSRELVAFTGGGGKTTLLVQLGEELAGHQPVLLTTTTKLGLDQTEDAVVAWTPDEVEGAIAESPGRPVFVLSGRDGHKVRGLAPAQVDELFDTGPAPYVLVEADGSRGRPLKAPAHHEPVVPSLATLVVVVVGSDAVGQSYSTAAHRPETAAELAGAGIGDRITAEAVAAIVTSPRGGLKGIPAGARVIVALTKVEERTRPAAHRIAALVEASGRVQGVITVPFRHPAERRRDEPPG